MTDSFSQTAALLYSPQSRDPSLIDILDRLRNDPVLVKKIRLISTDNSGVRELLRSNESGVSVKKWPVFAVKSVKDRTPTLYPITSYEEVFKLFRPSKEPKSPTTGQVVAWNSVFFSKGTVEMTVSEGDSLHFKSDDDLIHDVTLADSSWKPIRRLIPRQKNIDRSLTINDDLFRGHCHLISSMPQDHQMRLVLHLGNPIDEIIDGIGECSSLREYEDREKSGPVGLRTNSIIARIRVPAFEFPPEDEIQPRTTFAQRQLAKLQ